MLIGNRLKQLRDEKHLSQGDIEQRTGLLRCYVSRIENNHTVPSVETLVKMARALEVPMYRLFYDGEDTPPKMELPKQAKEWGGSQKDAALVERFRKSLSKMSAKDRATLLAMTQQLARNRKEAR